MAALSRSRKLLPLVVAVAFFMEALEAGDFRVVFLIVALLPLASMGGYLRLRPLDGAGMSGHRAVEAR